MTAFASGETEISPLIINCDFRSVNHRYCDLTLKIPDRFRFAEAEIRRLIGKKIKRGKVECALNYKKQNSENTDLSINMDAVNALLAASRQIASQMDAPLAFSALDVLAFPGVQQDPEADKEQLKKILLTLIENTLNQLLDSRQREGTQLGILIEERCQKILELAGAANKRLPVVLQQLREKLHSKIADLVADPDTERLEQEMVLLAQKLDVAEEIDRLVTHVNEVQRVLKLNEPIGRRLDFLMQELNREANTLGSKSADKEMTQISIELKVLIEQMREQVQNIE